MVSRRREYIVVSGIFALVVAAYAWSGHFWVDVVDEGYFLDLANRVLNGALPYRDFATYYTPGVFYLFAAAFKVFGTNLLTIRLVMTVVRGLCLLLVYGLTRRLAPPAWAWLPVACIVGFDAWPIEPEPHPSWPALVACLAAIECLARHLATDRRRWLLLAGAATAVSFLFKQNTGAFTALGLVAYVLLRPRANTDWRLRSTQFAFTATTAVLVIWLMHPLLDPLWTVGLLLALLVCLVGLQLKAMRVSSVGPDGVLLDSLAAGGAFFVVTAAWLVPLGAALGPANLPLGLFAGQLDQASLAEALPSVSFDSLNVYLPSLALWVAAIGLFARSPRFGALYAYCALFGALVGLTLYPRADSLHALVTSPPALIAATAVLAHVAQQFSGWRHVATAAAMLAVPAAVLSPQMAWRVSDLGAPDSASGQRLEFVQLGLPRATVLVPLEVAEDLGGVVRYVEAGTPPGEPLLAYPVIPLVNFLANRPNPTRFDHFLPGSLSPADLDEAIREVRERPPRYVVWDDYGVNFWGTDPDNRPLSDYIWSCYQEVAAFREYLVLERKPGGC